jgi:nucleoside-diphosphate-sugar epimerase
MKVLVTGSTGMVGRLALEAALRDNRIREVVVINRSSLDRTHPKLRQLLCTDFALIDEVLKGEYFDACFHVMGVSAVGMSEANYRLITLTYTQYLVDALLKGNLNCAIVYVSGAGTDQTQQSRQMWARVKGETERYIISRAPGASWMLRPGVILPGPGVRSKVGWYQWFYTLTRPLFPLFRRIPSVLTSDMMGRVFVEVLFRRPEVSILEAAEMRKWLASGSL